MFITETIRFIVSLLQLSSRKKKWQQIIYPTSMNIVCVYIYKGEMKLW